MTRTWAFILSAVILRLERLLNVIFDDRKGVCWREAPNVAGAINGFIYFAVRSENKACRVYEGSDIIKKSPCHGGECPGIQSIGNGEGQPFPFYGFLGILETVCWSGNDLNFPLIKIRNARLKISQLLTTERSPSSPVDQEDSPGAFQHIRNSHGIAVCKSNLHPWKQVTAVKFPLFCLRHNYRLPSSRPPEVNWRTQHRQYGKELNK